MGILGMLPMVASVIDSQSGLIGFVYHMVNSSIIDALYGFAFGNQSHISGQGAMRGLLYGVIW